MMIPTDECDRGSSQEQFRSNVELPHCHGMSSSARPIRWDVNTSTPQSLSLGV